MKTIHLIYPHGSRISTPDAIGRHLGQQLGQHYRVVYHDLESLVAIHPDPDDVLVGHAMPSPFTCFRRSLKQPGWRRVILISPFSHADPGNNAFIDQFIHRCNLYLAITGNYWFRTTANSVFAHWSPKMIHLDMAVDRADFPVIKSHFNPKGFRSFIYIGIDTPQKNLGYLNRIASQLPGTCFSWIGTGHTFSHLKPLGFMDFSNLQARDLVQQHDFMITVGRSDANPTTILEAMSWGLIPVCTEQSGYVGFPGIINLPLGDVAQAANFLRDLQDVPNACLLEMQAVNWQVLDEHFNWDRFARQVIDAIESDASPSIGPVPIGVRLYIRWMELLSPYAIWRRPRYLSRLLIYTARQLFVNHKNLL